MIPGDLLSAFPHRQFHTLPGLLDSWAALPNSNPNACMPMQGGSLYHFYDGLWYDPAGRRTHDLPCERRTRYRLSQPDTVDSNILLPSYGHIQRLSQITVGARTVNKKCYMGNSIKLALRVPGRVVEEPERDLQIHRG